MDLLLCLETIISDFRPLFNQQNFMLFNKRRTRLAKRLLEYNNIVQTLVSYLA